VTGDARFPSSSSGRLTVLKLGGELIEAPDGLAEVTAAIGRLAGRDPLLVVHGGGREIDVEMARRGLAKVAVDGLRVTDEATLDAVVAVLAGTVNTRLVAALSAAGVPAVGLTGADASCVRVVRAPPHRAVDGRLVDLGLVGEPIDDGVPPLLADLLARGYVPVVACLGAEAGGRVLNVNADTLAAHLASTLSAARLVLAGSTPGVLDRHGAVVPELTPADAVAMAADGTASAGMVAKLAACRTALERGVCDVAIVDGRDAGALVAGRGSRLVAAASVVHDR
jgi:acetylglutamate kinase